MQIAQTIAPTRAGVLSKGLVRTLELWGLSGRDAGRIIGLSDASISRLKRGDMLLDETAKPFELAVMVVRAFRSLDAITGGDIAAARAWLRSPNTALGMRPIEAMQTVGGLVNVVAYLDARRAPL